MFVQWHLLIKSDVLIQDYGVLIPDNSIQSDGEDDVDESEIWGRELESDNDVVVVICPGKGVDCRVTLIDANNNPTIILAKKTRGGPDVTVSQF